MNGNLYCKTTKRRNGCDLNIHLWRPQLGNDFEDAAFGILVQASEILWINGKRFLQKFLKSVRRPAALKSGHFQNTKISPTCAIYNNSNIGFQLNLSVIKF
jgi:hypothetical protein